LKRIFENSSISPLNKDVKKSGYFLLKKPLSTRSKFRKKFQNVFDFFKEIERRIFETFFSHNFESRK